MRAVLQNNWPGLRRNVDGTKTKQRKVRAPVRVRGSPSGLSGGPEEMRPPGSWDGALLGKRVFGAATRLRVWRGDHLGFPWRALNPVTSVTDSHQKRQETGRTLPWVPRERDLQHPGF